MILSQQDADMICCIVRYFVLIWLFCYGSRVEDNKIIGMKQSQNLPEVRRKIGQYSYVPKDVIGKGYSSIVYRGHNDSTGESIALKLIDMKNVKGEVHKTLLANEIDVLKTLTNHENIIRLHQVIPLKSHTCIVTELCDGGDLAKLIKEQHRLPQLKATELLGQIMNGYRGIHRQGIVHRDLKPANIFFSAKDVKIADFGFAVRSQQLKKHANYNVGSPVYMPLQALNDNIYSPKSDVWAIGVIFYEMLTGNTPWRAKTEADLKRQIKAVPIKSILPVGVSKLGAAFLTRALQLNPASRMGPQEMVGFFQEGREPTAEPLNLQAIGQRTNSLFRTRAVSHDHEQRPEFNTTSKNMVTAPKTFRKISVTGQGNPRGLERIEEVADRGEKLWKLQKLEKVKKCEDDALLQRLGQHKLGHLARTVARLGEWAPDHKKTSSQLLSQVHFCRFFYKLLQRMAAVGEGSMRLRQQMRTLLAGKLADLKHLRLITPRHATIFRTTREFERIQQVVDQYALKYAQFLNGEIAMAYEDALTNIDTQLCLQIGKLYRQVMVEGEGKGWEEKIVLLDYLITMKQLLLINEKKDIEYFHQKSQIEAIVEGRPAKSITQQHLQAILHKLKVFKMIP